MGLKVVGGSIEGTIVMLQQTGERTVKHVSEVLVEGGELIAETAKTMAPVEHGDLRESIESTVTRSGTGGRIEVTVDINPNATDERGEPTIVYGAIMHEALAPYGSGAFNLGKLSAELAASGAPIGGKFMARALKEHRSKIYSRAEAMARGAAQRRVAVKKATTTKVKK
jgi:hypothetical protein